MQLAASRNIHTRTVSLRAGAFRPERICNHWLAQESVDVWDLGLYLGMYICQLGRRRKELGDGLQDLCTLAAGC